MSFNRAGEYHGAEGFSNLDLETFFVIIYGNARDASASSNSSFLRQYP